MASLVQLPFDVIVEIIYKLDPKDVLNLERVCKLFRNEFRKEDDRIWKHFALCEYPHSQKWFDDWKSLLNDGVKTWKTYFWTQVRSFLFPYPTSPLGANDTNTVDSVAKISPDRTHATCVRTHGVGQWESHRILLLQPPIPKIGTHYVSLKVPSSSDGLWIGVTLAPFQQHFWLGCASTSFGVGSHCANQVYRNANSVQVRGLRIGSGSTITMEVDRQLNRLTFFVDGKHMPGFSNLAELGTGRKDSEHIADFHPAVDNCDLHFAVSFWVNPAEVKILSRAETHLLLKHNK
mmetsp:Transcript_29715/g.41829  ORF Transcript_29715/g.41829 Transcript_29715/m.41829 type:complete len:291 (-) Transcript_29715:9-881(-)